MCLVTCKNKKYNEYRDQRAEFTPYSEMRRVSAVGVHAADVHAAVTHAAVTYVAAVWCGL